MFLFSENFRTIRLFFTEFNVICSHVFHMYNISTRSTIFFEYTFIINFSNFIIIIAITSSAYNILIRKNKTAIPLSIIIALIFSYIFVHNLFSLIVKNNTKFEYYTISNTTQNYY